MSSADPMVSYLSADGIHDEAREKSRRRLEISQFWESKRRQRIDFTFFKSYVPNKEHLL